MKELGIDCYLVFVRETAAMADPVRDLIIGGDVVWDSAFIFHTHREKLTKIAIVGNFDADAERAKGIWTDVLPYTKEISETLQKAIRNLRPSKIAINYSVDDVMADGLTHGMFIKLQTILSSYKRKFESAEKLIGRIRGRKTKTELELIRNACLETETINRAVLPQIRPSMNEKEIQQAFYQEMDQRSVKESWQRISCPAIDVGPDKNFGHLGPIDTMKAKHGHTLHNDFGVQLEGYCSDIQRMAFFGPKESIPDELTHAFETVREAIRKAAEFIKPGVKGFEVDNVARNYVLSRGYSEYQHALGHQVGVRAHDGGVLLGPLWERYGDTPKGEIEENNIFTLELYVTTKNYGMVSLEEMIRVTGDGCEFIIPPQEAFITLAS